MHANRASVLTFGKKINLGPNLEYIRLVGQEIRGAWANRAAIHSAGSLPSHETGLNHQWDCPTLKSQTGTNRWFTAWQANAPLRTKTAASKRGKHFCFEPGEREREAASLNKCECECQPNYRIAFMACPPPPPRQGRCAAQEASQKDG